MFWNQLGNLDLFGDSQSVNYGKGMVPIIPCFSIEKLNSRKIILITRDYIASFELIVFYFIVLYPELCQYIYIFFKMFIYLYIYMYFFFGCVALGLRCCVRAFSSCGEQGLLFITVHRLLVAVASVLLWSTGSRCTGFGSCGLRAQLLRGMWDLPRPGLEPVSPALSGGFLTSAPPGKSHI